MLRFYAACSLIALVLYATAQLRGWTVFGSDAEEFQRRRAERAEEIRSYRAGGSGSSGSGGGFSGHK